MAYEQRYLKHLKYVFVPISSLGGGGLNTTDLSFIGADDNNDVTTILFGGGGK